MRNKISDARQSKYFNSVMKQLIFKFRTKITGVFMKKGLLFSSLLFLLISCSEAPSSIGWFKGGFEEAINTSGNRLVMLEFYTDT
jgi:hypothetical protein